MFLFKKTKIQCIKITLDLLAGYHAVPLDNPEFRKQYRHIFSMLATLTKGKNNV